MKRSKKSYLFWGCFWRYGIIGIAIVLFVLSGILVLNVEGLYPDGMYIVGLSFGLPLFIMGADYVLASLLKWPHIALVSQSAYHQKMNPEKINWEAFRTKEYVFIGVFFMVLSLLIILVSFLF